MTLFDLGDTDKELKEWVTKKCAVCGAEEEMHPTCKICKACTCGMSIMPKWGWSCGEALPCRYHPKTGTGEQIFHGGKHHDKGVPCIDCDIEVKYGKVINS